MDINVDFELYKFFYYVAKNHYITKTANELHVTQPSVSKAIKNLEEQLGCTLFIRNKYGVVDILILNLSYPIPNDFEVIPLCDLHDIFVANKDYLFLKNFTKLGLGIGFVTREYLDDELDGELFEIKTKEKILSRKLGIVIRKNQELSHASKMFLEILKEKS